MMSFLKRWLRNTSIALFAITFAAGIGAVLVTLVTWLVEFTESHIGEYAPPLLFAVSFCVVIGAITAGYDKP